MEDERKWSRTTVQDDRSGNAETSFAEIRGCSRHGQISTFRRTETGSAREIRHSSGAESSIDDVTFEGEEVHISVAIRDIGDAEGCVVKSR